MGKAPQRPRSVKVRLFGNRGAPGSERSVHGPRCRCRHRAHAGMPELRRRRQFYVAPAGAAHQARLGVDAMGSSHARRGRQHRGPVRSPCRPAHEERARASSCCGRLLRQLQHHRGAIGGVVRDGKVASLHCRWGWRLVCLWCWAMAFCGYGARGVWRGDTPGSGQQSRPLPFRRCGCSGEGPRSMDIRREGCRSRFGRVEGREALGAGARHPRVGHRERQQRESLPKLARRPDKYGCPDRPGCRLAIPGSKLLTGGPGGYQGDRRRSFGVPRVLASVQRCFARQFRGASSQEPLGDTDALGVATTSSTGIGWPGWN